MDIFVAGFPKTGTTALSEHLRKNKSVFIPNVKEPHYFGSDIRPFSSITNTKDYLHIYKRAKNRQKKFDFSTLYCLSTDAVKEILCWNNDSKFIIMMRKPWDSILSYYHELQISFNDYRPSFESAWEQNSPCPKSRMGQFSHYQYMMDLDLHLKKFYGLHENGRCLFLFHDDMVNNPMSFINDVTNFCEIEPMGANIPWVHSKYEYRSTSIAKLYRNPPKMLIPLKKQIKKLFIGRYITKTFTFLNEKQMKNRPTIDEDVLNEVKQFAKNQIMQISKHIDIPQNWLK